MGGKLWNLPRMPRRDYLAVEADVRRYLDSALPGQYRVPRYYGDKPDFGDMDVIVTSRPDWDEVRASIVRDLGISQVKSVGNVTSTVFRGLQTDFFTVPSTDLESAYAYMSFNDLGNFIGKLCRRFNLKYGEDGLTYVFRRERGNYKTSLPVTRDFEEICGFLGLDHGAWVEGFATLSAMFAWVVASPYFSVAPYLDEPKGNLGQKRAERTTVARFVDYLRARGVDKRPAMEDRHSYLPAVMAAFPEARLDEQIAREREREARDDRLASKFSGQRVMRLVPGVTGQALAELIMGFKRSVPDFYAFILETPEEEIDRRIVAFAASRAR